MALVDDGFEVDCSVFDRCSLYRGNIALWNSNVSAGDCLILNFSVSHGVDVYYLRNGKRMACNTDDEETCLDIVREVFKDWPKGKPVSYIRGNRVQ